MKYRHHLSRQILLGCLAFTLILGVLFTTISVVIFRDGMVAQYRTRIRDAINLTLARLDVEDLEQCMQTCEPTPAYASLVEFMDQMRQNGLVDYLIISKPVKNDDGYDVISVASGLLQDERAGESKKNFAIPKLGESSAALYPAERLPALYEDMLSRRDVNFSISNTEFGTAYDGAQAIFNAGGKGVALVNAGISVSSIKASLLQYGGLMLAGIAASAALFLLLMNGWLNRRVVKPLKLIERAAGELVEKTHIQVSPEALVIERPDIHSGNELESLSNTVVALSESMRTYAENLLRSAVRVEDMKQEVSKANDMALKDALTDVRNKAAFVRTQAELDQDIERGGAMFGLVMIDLNFLKEINDTHGHDKGDLYLKNTCTLICNTFTHSPVYRVGGDEFVVLLKNVDLASRDVLFKRFRQGMRTDPYLNPWDRVSAALGFAMYDPTTDHCAADVLARADKYMYENKRFMKSAAQA